MPPGRHRKESFMRSRTTAPWVTCALVLVGLVVGSNVEAQKKARKPKKIRSISSCMKYSQSMSEVGIHLTLDNRCDADLSCDMSWSLRCDGSDDEKASKRSGTDTLFVSMDDSQSAFASAAACGDQGWRVTDVRWGCKDPTQ
jgi:hypothetical protein